MADEVLALDHIQIRDFAHESPLQVTCPSPGSPQNPIVVSDLDLAPLGSMANPIPIDLEPAHSPGTPQNPIVIDDDYDVAAFNSATDPIPIGLDNAECSRDYSVENKSESNVDTI